MANGRALDGLPDTALHAVPVPIQGTADSDHVSGGTTVDKAAFKTQEHQTGVTKSLSLTLASYSTRLVRSAEVHAA